MGITTPGAGSRPPWLPRLLRTTSFRLTVLFAVLLVASVSVLFSIVQWSVGRATERQLNGSINDEITELWADAGSHDLAALQGAVGRFARRQGGMHYLLQDRGGRVLAGNMHALDPAAGLRVLPGARASSQIRGRGMILPGGYLFVGLDDGQTPRLRAAIADAFLLSLAITVALGLGGGLLASLSLLRRVEAIGRTSRDIMAGDLDRRISLRGTRDEFDQLGAVLNAMLDRIQGLMSGVQQVSSDIAHDLRTPLNRLRQRLEMAAAHESTVAGLRQALGGSLDDVEAILATFSALLRIAQVQSGSRRSQFAAVALAPLLSELVESYQPVAEERGQTIQGCCQPATVQGDAELLVQMAVNLIENAIRHGGSGTHIRVGCVTMADGAAVLSVADDGPGIPAGQRNLVRGRFYRLDVSRSTTGSGLGLALVDSIAGLHDARLELADAEPGLAVTVRFALPDGVARPAGGRRRAVAEAAGPLA